MGRGLCFGHMPIHKDEDAFLRTDSEKKKKRIVPPSLFFTSTPSHLLMKTERTNFFSFFASLKKENGLPLKILVNGLRILLE